ncbi:MAG: hypothetical protein OHK0011_25500 [Turneriella sp.]
MVMTRITRLGAEDEAADEIIENENRLVVRAYGLTRSTEEFLRGYLRRVLEETGRPELAATLEIILKELTTNAAKANFKKIFFAENQLRIDDPDHYEQGIVRFRETFSEQAFREYRQKAQASELLVLIALDYDPDRVILEIRNNVPMTPEEEKRAREKLRLAMSYEDMGQFIMDNADETEGAGLGIMLCLTTMRSASIDPRLLSISTDFRTHTLARVEVPLHEGYTPARKRYDQRRRSA